MTYVTRSDYISTKMVGLYGVIDSHLLVSKSK